ncbi:MAG: hypothetical protein ACJAT2_000307 [Bacteriovoracaceae bacterium]|jgi:hypothetical protein
MKKKPFIFIALGLLHIVEPMFKMLYFKLHTGFDWAVVATNILAVKSPIDVFHFWLLFPIAGFALISVKKWSHPLFVGIQAYSLYIHLTYEKFTWPYVAETPFLGSLILLSLNAIMIIYFLLPHVRKPFFDKDVRWWEHHRRYNKVFPCTFSIVNPNKLIDAYALNISLSGAFINHQGIVEDGQHMMVNLSFDNVYLSIKAEKVSNHAFGGSMGMGIQFIYESYWDRIKMKRLIKAIAKANKFEEKIALAA